MAVGAMKQAVEIGGHEQGGEEQVLLKARDAREPLRERNGEQEREQDLDARQGDPQLLQELCHLPLGSLALVHRPTAS